MPPGMLQQMQRQIKGNNGLQEMMKAMMQGQGGDQLDVEEMQSKLWAEYYHRLWIIRRFLGMMSQMGGLGGLEGLGGLRGGMADMFKMMGMGSAGR